MVAARINPARALRAATATAAELLGRSDVGVLEPGRVADIVAMPATQIPDDSQADAARSLARVVTNS